MAHGGTRGEGWYLHDERPVSTSDLGSRRSVPVDSFAGLVELVEQEHQPEQGEWRNQEQQTDDPLPSGDDDGTGLDLVDGSVENVDGSLFSPTGEYPLVRYLEIARAWSAVFR